MRDVVVLEEIFIVEAYCVIADLFFWSDQISSCRRGTILHFSHVSPSASVSGTFHSTENNLLFYHRDLITQNSPFPCCLAVSF